MRSLEASSGTHMPQLLGGLRSGMAATAGACRSQLHTAASSYVPGSLSLQLLRTLRQVRICKDHAACIGRMHEVHASCGVKYQINKDHTLC